MSLTTRANPELITSFSGMGILAPYFNAFSSTAPCRNALDDEVCREGARLGRCHGVFERDCRKACGACREVEATTMSTTRATAKPTTPIDDTGEISFMTVLGLMMTIVALWTYASVVYTCSDSSCSYETTGVSMISKNDRQSLKVIWP